MSGNLYRPAQWRGFAEDMRKMLKGDLSPLAGFLIPPATDDAQTPDLQGFSFDSVFVRGSSSCVRAAS